MVYLGPITRLTPRLKTRPSTGYEPDRDILISSELPEHLPPNIERRRGDRRRGQKRDAQFSSRSGTDRRQPPRPKVDIEV